MSWSAHPAKDVIGYNIYRGVASIRTVRKGTPAAWADNDPEYAEPMVVELLDVKEITRLNDRPRTQTTFVDQVDLTRKGPQSTDYRYLVYAYIVRAINRLGTESGPSPCALTIPSEPVNVLCREDGEMVELKWDANLEKGISDYHVYKLQGGVFNIVRVTDRPISTTSFTHRPGRDATRYWITAADALGQEGQPSSPVWCNHSYPGFYKGEWHQ